MSSNAAPHRRCPKAPLLIARTSPASHMVERPDRFDRRMPTAPHVAAEEHQATGFRPYRISPRAICATHRTVAQVAHQMDRWPFGPCQILLCAGVALINQAFTLLRRSISVIGCCGDSWKP